MFDQTQETGSTQSLSEASMGEPQDLDDAIGQLAGLEAAVRRRLLEFIVAFDRKELWRQDGASCMASWLSYRLGVAFRTAAEWVDIAHALTKLPAIAAAYDSGTLSWDQLRACVTMATPETDAEIADLAQKLGPAQLEHAARRARAARLSRPAGDRRDRYVTWHLDQESWLRLRGHLPPDQGAVVAAALERLKAKVPRNPDGTWDTSEARGADALVELASTRLAADSDADRATVVVHVDEPALTGNKGIAETESGALLDHPTVEELVCDCRVQFVTHDPQGKAVGIGHTSRKIPSWLMRQLRRRDRTCRFPGCNRRCFVQGHHIKHWPRGGPTELPNLLLLCRYHHQLVHHGKWKIRGDPAGEVEFIRPDGRVLEVGPPPLRLELRERLLA